MRAAAASVGVGERTLWRWLTAGRQLVRGRPNPTRLVLGDELHDGYLRLGGNAAFVGNAFAGSAYAANAQRICTGIDGTAASIVETVCARTSAATRMSLEADRVVARHRGAPLSEHPGPPRC